MSSVVDICNLALSHLGDSATLTSIDPPEGSAQADHCAQFYPIARDTLLEMHAWSFTTRTAAGATLINDREDDWGFCYGIPNKAVVIRGVYLPGESTNSGGQPYVKELNSSGVEVIYTDVENAVIRYSIPVSDTTKFPPLFVQTLSWHLASMLAGPIMKGDAGIAEAKRCAQMMATWFVRATGSNSNQANNKPVHMPAHLSAR